MRKAKDYGTGIPRQEVETFARCLLPDIQAFFESQAGQQEFAEWQKNQKSLKQTKTA